MDYLLGSSGKAVLQRWTRKRTLLAFDYDGTLAPIQRTTIEAWMRPGTLERWGELCSLTPCAMVSGRGLDDLRTRLQGVGPCSLAGNHGMEVDGGPPASKQWTSLMNGWVRTLRKELNAFEGVFVEPKRYSLSVHWRGAPRASRLTQKVRAVAQQLEGVRLIGGKQVMNVVPIDAPNKGDATRFLMKRLDCPHALFAGDDITDEDGFALSAAEGSLGLRIGLKRETRARYYLRSQLEIDALLEYLIALLRVPRVARKRSA